MIFVLGLTAGVFAAVLGWQVNLMALQHGVKHHNPWGVFFIGIGATLADLMFLVIGSSGIVSVVRHAAWMEALRKACGISILLIAVGMFFEKRRAQENTKPVSADTFAKDFMSGFLLVAGNPAVLALWAAVSASVLSYFSGFRTFALRIFFYGGFVAGSLGWFLYFAFFLIKNLRNLQFITERTGKIRKISAILLGVMSIWFLVTP